MPFLKTQSSAIKGFGQPCIFEMGLASRKKVPLAVLFRSASPGYVRFWPRLLPREARPKISTTSGAWQKGTSETQLVALLFRWHSIQSPLLHATHAALRKGKFHHSPKPLLQPPGRVRISLASASMPLRKRSHGKNKGRLPTAGGCRGCPVMRLCLSSSPRLCRFGRFDREPWCHCHDFRCVRSRTV